MHKEARQRTTATRLVKRPLSSTPAYIPNAIIAVSLLTAHDNGITPNFRHLSLTKGIPCNRCLQVGVVINNCNPSQREFPWLQSTCDLHRNTSEWAQKLGSGLSAWVLRLQDMARFSSNRCEVCFCGKTAPASFEAGDLATLTHILDYTSSPFWTVVHFTYSMWHGVRCFDYVSYNNNQIYKFGSSYSIGSTG